MKCLGRTRTLRRCQRSCKRLFCHHHWYQPILFFGFVITSVATAGGVYRDVIEPIVYSSPESENRLAPSRGDLTADGDGRFQDMLLRSAQELRRNKEYLRSVQQFHRGGDGGFPLGQIKVDSTLELFREEYSAITRFAYGEEKYIYQLVLELRDIGEQFNTVHSLEDIQDWNASYATTVDDVAFLCGFLFWYIAPVAEADLDSGSFRTLGWFSKSPVFARAEDVKHLEMNRFVFDGRPIIDYGEYLGLID